MLSDLDARFAAVTSEEMRGKEPFPYKLATMGAQLEALKWNDTMVLYDLLNGMPCVGDGYSDLCAAEDAEVRFARASLITHLEREGFSYVPFENMHDVRIGLADALGVAP